MQLSRTAGGFLLLVSLAGVGALMIWLPAEIAQQYQAIKEFGSFWVTIYFIIVGTGAALLFGATGYIIWLLWSRSREKRITRQRRDKNPSELSTADKQREYQENLASIGEISQDPHVSDELKSQLQPLIDRLDEKEQRQKLEIVAFGTVSSGKSSLLNALAGRDVFVTDLRGGTTIVRQEIEWPGMDQVFLVDTPGLGEVEGADHIAIAAVAAKDADIVLVVVDGPVRESEYKLLSKLGEMEKRLLLCLNKVDWYSQRDRDELVGQIVRQVAPFASSDDVVTVRAQATTRPRIRVSASGEEIEERVEVPADISPLARRMMEVIRREGKEILMANLLLQSRGLVEEARQKAQDALDARARTLVDRYTWAAGGAAAVSPLPWLDLLAGGAVTAKMIYDLGAVYRQKVDFEMATEFAKQMGKNFIAFLGVTAATPIVISTVASLLKTVPGAGTIAGGMLQGIVQALVTRWIGLVFIEYFKNEMKTPEGGLAGLARRQWQQLTSIAELHRFVIEARNKLLNKN